MLPVCGVIHITPLRFCESIFDAISMLLPASKPDMPHRSILETLMRRSCLWFSLVAFLPFSVGAVESVSLKVPMVAVMPFTGRSLDADASDGIAATLATDLLNTGKFRVMERSQMESILKEQGFQQSGACDGSECAVEVGKLLSVDHMVVGTVAKVGGTYVVNARLVSVQTGEVLQSASRTTLAEVDAIVTDLLPQLSKELASSSIPATAPVASPVPAPLVASPEPSRKTSDSATVASTPVATSSGGGSHWGWWLAGGAVVAGGATAAVLLLSSKSSGTNNSASASSSSSSSQSVDMVMP